MVGCVIEQRLVALLAIFASPAAFCRPALNDSQIRQQNHPAKCRGLPGDRASMRLSV
jgi:hypothetical protein